MRTALRPSPADVPLDLAIEQIGPQVEKCLESKGYCVLAWDAQRLGSNALKEAEALSRAGRLKQLPRILAGGLLGERGSRRSFSLAEVEAHSRDLPAMRQVNQRLSDIAALLDSRRGVAPYWSISGRSDGLLLETGPTIDAPLPGNPEFSDQECLDWHSLLCEGRILALAFLGPSPAVLELTVVGGKKSAEPLKVTTSPGTIVLLRHHALLREHRSTREASFVLSCFFLPAKRMTSNARSPKLELHPAAAALHKWMVGRACTIKESSLQQDDIVDAAVPRSLQRLSNVGFLSGLKIAVRGSSCRFANSWGTETFQGAMIAGADWGMEVPADRWDHSAYYDPNPESHLWGKTACMHMSYAPGMELFDNKFFQISVSEASRMDPCDRQIMEVGWEACANAGLERKDMMGGDCGIYVAANSEFVQIEDRGMQANRLSFCLGCKGPSLAIDADHASALLATRVACNEIGMGCQQALAIGGSVCINPAFWRAHCQLGYMSATSRCFAFDAHATGFIRADAVGSIYVKPLFRTVDGKEVWDQAGTLLGVVEASCAKSQGRAAGFLVPSGACIQEIILESVRSAKITNLDVDFVECDAKGSVLGDAVEARAILRALRPQATSTETVVLGSVKSGIGSAWPCAGMVSIIKTLCAGRYGALPPIVHLRKISPTLADEADGPALLPCEALVPREDSGFYGVTGCGLGGTNVHVLLWNNIDVALLQPTNMRPLPVPNLRAVGMPESLGALSETEASASESESEPGDDLVLGLYDVDSVFSRMRPPE